MPAYRQIGFRIVVDDSGRLLMNKFEKGVSKSSKVISTSGKKVEAAWKRAKRVLSTGWGRISGMMRGFGGIAKSVFRTMTSFKTLLVSGALTYGLYKLGKSFLSTASDMEKYNLQLGTVLGSMEAAESHLKWLLRFAAGKPFEVPELVETSILLEAVGIQSKEIMTILGDTAFAMGKDIFSVGNALISMEAEVLRRLGIEISAQADKAIFKWKNRMGETIETVAEGGRIIQREVLLSIWNEKFEGGMKKAAGMWGAMMADLGDKWFEFKNKIMSMGIFDLLKKGMKGVLDWIDKLSETGQLDRIAIKFSNAILKIIGQGAELLNSSIGFAQMLVEILTNITYYMGRIIAGWKGITTTAKSIFYAFQIEVVESNLESLQKKYAETFTKIKEYFEAGARYPGFDILDEFSAIEKTILKALTQQEHVQNKIKNHLEDELMIEDTLMGLEKFREKTMGLIDQIAEKTKGTLEEQLPVLRELIQGYIDANEALLKQNKLAEE